jgi:hypothetical protein
MGLFDRVVKPAGETTDDQPGRHTIHGSNPQWEIRKAQGNLRRWNEKPKPVPWSREKPRP